MATRIREMRLAATGVLLLCAMVMQAHAATITVTNTNDSGPGSLRQALTIANDGDTITFSVTGTITLTSGGLLIAKNLTISGLGSNQLSIDGNQAVLVFGIFPDKTVAISGLSIRNGQNGIWNEGTLTVSDCVVSGNSYEGLLNDYSLTVSDCVVSGNSGDGIGNDHATLTVSNCIVTANSYVGIGNVNSHGPSSSVQRGNDRRDAKNIYGVVRGSLTVANSIISDNSAGGIYNNGGSVMILNSTLSGNSVGQGYDGGGISSGSFKSPGDVTIINSTISGNSAQAGGGIASYFSSVTIINSTISGNSAKYDGGGIAGDFMTIMNSTVSGNSAGDTGGGIRVSGPVQIANSTFSGNSAGSGGGIYNVAGYYEATLEIGNTILNAGASGENIFNDGGTVTSHGYNVCSDNGGGYLTGPGDQINTDPLLGPLQDNGGPTLTHAPLPGSPAIDAGDPNFTPPPFRDQRGRCFYRVFGRRIDVGSVEIQPQPRCPTPAPRPTPH
jgi:hypothetical protein